MPTPNCPGCGNLKDACACAGQWTVIGLGGDDAVEIGKHGSMALRSGDAMIIISERQVADLLNILTHRARSPLWPERHQTTAPVYMIRNLLLLAGVDVPEASIAEWTAAQRKVAVDWATAMYLAASDNAVTVPKRPDFLPAQVEP
jgi:hypothetical protein